MGKVSADASSHTILPSWDFIRREAGVAARGFFAPFGTIAEALGAFAAPRQHSSSDAPADDFFLGAGSLDTFVYSQGSLDLALGCDVVLDFRNDDWTDMDADRVNLEQALDIGFADENQRYRMIGAPQFLSEDSEDRAAEPSYLGKTMLVSSGYRPGRRPKGRGKAVPGKP